MNYDIVTGACGGIGKELCKRLALGGNNLILVGRDEEKLSLLSSELKALNPSVKIDYKAVDLASENSVNSCFSYLLDKNYIISGLYYVAGIDTRKGFEKYDYNKLIMQSRVNFESAVLFSKFALENRASNLKMMIISSACGLTPMPYFSLYSATKSALIYFFKGLKAELKGKGVKITVVCPGSVTTRDEIIEDIKAQGLQGKLSKKSPKFVCEKSLNALKKNKTVYIPGFYNRVVLLTSKLTPYAIKSKIIAKKFKNKEKDAF